MSCTATPTKTSAERPPILPPVRTTFDGTPDGDGESALAWMADNVRRMIRHVDASQAEELAANLDLLALRRKWVNDDLSALRMFEDFPLPPFEGFSVDFLMDRIDRTEATLLTLLGDIDECIARSERRLARHRLQMRLLRDLGASDS